MKSRYSVALVLAIALMVPTTDAEALRSRRSKQPPQQAAPATQQTPATQPAIDTTFLSKGEIGGYAGYMLAGELPVLRGDLIMVNGANYGGQLNVRLHPAAMVELGYSRLDTQLDFRPFVGPKEKLFDVAINHFSLGGLMELKPLSRVKPFALFTLGMTWFDTKTSAFDDEWNFTLAAGLGFKVFLHPKIGLRFQSRLVLPIYFDGGGIFCGTGGCGGGLTGGVVAAQADFSGGAFFAF